MMVIVERKKERLGYAAAQECTVGEMAEGGLQSSLITFVSSRNLIGQSREGVSLCFESSRECGWDGGWGAGSRCRPWEVGDRTAHVPGDGTAAPLGDSWGVRPRGSRLGS